MGIHRPVITHAVCCGRTSAGYVAFKRLMWSERLDLKPTLAILWWSGTDADEIKEGMTMESHPKKNGVVLFLKEIEDPGTQGQPDRTIAGKCGRTCAEGSPCVVERCRDPQMRRCSLEGAMQSTGGSRVIQLCKQVKKGCETNMMRRLLRVLKERTGHVGRLQEHQDCLEPYGKHKSYPSHQRSLLGECVWQAVLRQSVSLRQMV